ncbi:MAG: GHKL domain-containing protein [Spirochaetales bacterium]|nr:GHKL domain-containing protein [Spirochaetales bacterium]
MSRISFQNIDKTKPDVATSLLKPFLIYIEKKYDKAALIQFVRETGMDIEFLENGHNWISFDYYNLFLKKLVEFTDNPKAPFEAGIYVLSPQSYPSLRAILIVLKLFATPGMFFKRIAELTSSISNIGKFELLQTRRRKILFKSKLFEGYKQTRYNCDAIKGIAAAIPRFWDLPFARVKEIQCAAEGAESCIYEISWIPRPFKNILFTIGTVCILIGEIIFFFVQKEPLLRIEHLLLSAGFFTIIYFINKIFKFRTILKENEEIQKERTRELERAIAISKKEYMELQEANLQIVEKANKLSILNYISEEISKIDQEDDMLLLIIKIIIDCIGFERGFYYCMNNYFDVLKEPLSFNKLDSKIKKQPELVQYTQNKRWITSIFTKKRPQIISQKDLIGGENDNDIIFIPLAVHNTFFYLIGFDNFSSGKEIKEKNMQFFSTVGRQLEIAMNNIYSLRAARNVLSSIPSSIVVFDRNTLKISYVNTTYLKNFNQEIRNVLGENVFDFLKIPEHYKERFKIQIDRLQQKKNMLDQEYQVGQRTIGYTLFTMPDETGGKNEIGIIMKDITEQRDLQEQLLRGEKLAALGTLASGIAHEINNPLYGILGTAEVIVDETDNDEIKDLAKEIIDFSMQCSDIVKDLSTYSRSLREEKSKEVDINNLIEETLRIISYSPNFIDIKVNKELNDIPPFEAIGGEMRQIFMNIINNAIQALKGRGELVINTYCKEHFIIITIADTGPGIPQKIISKIFDPFFTTKPAGEGTGIGLNIVYRLVTKYNGFITVKSSPGEGAQFTIKLPVKE